MARTADQIQETFERDGDALLSREECQELGFDVPTMTPGMRYSLRNHSCYYSAKWVTESVVATRADVDEWVGRTI